MVASRLTVQQINDHFQQWVSAISRECSAELNEAREKCRLDDAAKQKQIKSIKGVFEMHVTNGSKTGGALASLFTLIHKPF